MCPVTTRVLLVEDDEDDSLLTRDLFTEAAAEGLEVDRVSTYEEAVAALDHQCYDIHLVDYRLGAHSGLDFVRLAISRGCPSPSILLTGPGSPEVHGAALEAGAVDLLVKGRFDADALVRSICYAVERKKVDQRLQQEAAVIEGVNEILLWAPTCGSNEDVAVRCLELARRLTSSEHAFMGEANASGRVDVIALARPDGKQIPTVLKDVHLCGAWDDVLKEARCVITNDPLEFPGCAGGLDTGGRCIRSWEFHSRRRGELWGSSASRTRGAGMTKPIASMSRHWRWPCLRPCTASGPRKNPCNNSHAPGSSTIWPGPWRVTTTWRASTRSS